MSDDRDLFNRWSVFDRRNINVFRLVLKLSTSRGSDAA
jgi:hypothetical protein